MYVMPSRNFKNLLSLCPDRRIIFPWRVFALFDSGPLARSKFRRSSVIAGAAIFFV